MHVLALLLAGLLPMLPAAAQPGGTAPAATAPCEKVYVVIWRINYDAAGQVTQVTLDSMFDPENGPTPEEAARRPIQMELPPAYLAAARTFLSQRPRRPGGPDPAYTFTIFDPAQPARADILSREDCLRRAPRLSRLGIFRAGDQLSQSATARA